MLMLSRQRALSFLALFNSMTFDFLTRLHMPGANLNMWIPSQCAAPAPHQIPEDAASHAAELSLTSTSVAQAVRQPVSKWNSSQRDVLDAECDALVAKAYGLTTAEYEVVLNHFKMLERLETQRFGEYHSKRLRLEAFEEIGGGR
jgi:hypothetical protein